MGFTVKFVFALLCYYHLVLYVNYVLLNCFSDADICDRFEKYTQSLLPCFVAKRKNDRMLMIYASFKKSSLLAKHIRNISVKGRFILCHP